MPSEPPISEPPDEPSPLSKRLQAAVKPEPPPEKLPREEREALAKRRLNTTLKGWRLTTLLGVGPVTAAYQAFRGAKDAKEQAVVKLLLGSAAENERSKSLFLRASYAANRFNHSRVLPIMEDGTDDGGAPFVVRPWANALPLSHVVDKETFGERDVLRIAEQVLDALEMAHAHGILHGAITPANILVTERRSIRLCDFATPPGLGPTRMADEDLLARLRVGPYSAPERCGAEPAAASEAGDVYSLAACMYFAITKQPPRGDAKGDALAATAARPIRELAPHVSEAFASIVDHALMIEPQQRYESAYAMLGDVRRVMAGRRPKLSDAIAPVPSQSLAELGQLPPSSRRIPASSAGREALPRSSGAATRAERKRNEWRGNLMLIFAIALLVGIATFVLVREKMQDEKRGAGDNASPPATGSAATAAPDDE